MDLATETSLRCQLDVSRRLPEDRAVEIAEAILRALEIAHANHKVHGDVRPENIHLDSNGSVQLGPPQTHSNEHWGYLAPEEITTGKIDYRADLYSVGVLLYEMLSARQPFTGGSPESIAYAITHFDAARQLEISGKMWAVISRALAKHPAERFTSADEFISAIEGARTVSHWGPTSYVVSEPSAPQISKSAISMNTSHAIKEAPATRLMIEPRQSGLIVAPSQTFAQPDYQMKTAALEATQSKKRGGLVIGAVVLILILGVSAINSLSDPPSQSTSNTFDEEYLRNQPKPQPYHPPPQESLGFSEKVVLRGGSSVLMPFRPSPSHGRFGSYQADTFTVTHTGAVYMAGELVDATPTTDRAVLHLYATLIAQSQNSVRVLPAASISHDGHAGAETTFMQSGRQEYKGRVVVYSAHDRIIFFLCKYPSTMEKTYNPTKFFGSIRI